MPNPGGVSQSGPSKPARPTRLMEQMTSGPQSLSSPEGSRWIEHRVAHGDEVNADLQIRRQWWIRRQSEDVIVDSTRTRSGRTVDNAARPPRKALVSGFRNPIPDVGRHMPKTSPASIAQRESVALTSRRSEVRSLLDAPRIQDVVGLRGLRHKTHARLAQLVEQTLDKR